MTTKALISLRNVSRTFQGANQPAVHAVRSVDLDVHEGDYVTITGRSGSGKSTLLNILGLLDEPTSGSYNFEGQATHTLSENALSALRGRRIGFVFQSFHLLEFRNATDNVALAQLYSAVPIADRRRAAEGMLKTVGLGHRATALPSTMSGGERQRVAVARALLNDPALVLCDEPTGNLDSETAESLLDLFDRLNEMGVTLVVITHDPKTAERGRRRYVMADGGLRQESTQTVDAL